MKGLLLKDWYLTVKYGRMLLFFAVLYGVMGMFMPELNAFTALPVMLMALLPNTIYAYDEREKWTDYVRALPVTDAQYVTGKYLYGTICLAVYFAVMTVVNLIARTEGFTGRFTMLFVAGLLMPSILMPFMFRFGTEKGRLAYIIVFASIISAVVALSNLRIFGNAALTAGRLGLPGWALCLTAAALYVLSWRLSIVLYRNRKNNGK